MSNEPANGCWTNFAYSPVPLTSGDASTFSQSVHESLVSDNRIITVVDHNISTTDTVPCNDNRFYTELQPAGLPAQGPVSFPNYPAQDSASLHVINGGNNSGHLQPTLAFNVPHGQMYTTPQAHPYVHPNYRMPNIYRSEQQVQQYVYQEQTYGPMYQQRPVRLMFFPYQAQGQCQSQLQQYQLPPAPVYPQNQQHVLYQQQQQIPPLISYQRAQFSLNQPCQQPYRPQLTYSQTAPSTNTYPSTETTMSASPSNQRRRVTQSGSIPRNVGRSHSLRYPHNPNQTSSAAEHPNTTEGSGPSSSPKTCVVCKNPSHTNRLGVYLCFYCQSAYETAVLLGQENCFCYRWPASQNDLDHIKSCWKCIVLKCVANGVVKAAVDPNRPYTKMEVPFDVLPRLLPGPKCSLDFNTSLGIVLARERLPEGRSLLSAVRDNNVLLTSSTESVINVICWTNEIPLFADFSIGNRTEILKSAILPLILMRFVHALASAVQLSSSPADLPPRAPQVNPENEVATISNFGTALVNRLRNEFVFAMREMEALNQTMELNESRLVVYLCSATFQPPEQPPPFGEIEINRMPLLQRAALRRLFDLAYVFKKLRLSEIAVSCLSLVLLFDNDKAEVPEDVKNDMKNRQKKAKKLLRCTFDKVNLLLGAMDFYKLLSYLSEIRCVTEKLILAANELTVRGIPDGLNFVGLKGIIDNVYPEYLMGMNS
ncbi:hypothetical protein Aperf_G00000009215 [Anoplocephala perfoliata]